MLTEVKDMETNLVLCSKFQWEKGEELPEEEACRVFVDPWDALSAFQGQVERTAWEIQGDPDKISCMCLSKVTAGYTCTAFWFRLKADPGDSPRTCLRRLARGVQAVSYCGMDPIQWLKGILERYDGGFYEPHATVRERIPVEEALEELAKVLAATAENPDEDGPVLKRKPGRWKKKIEMHPAHCAAEVIRRILARDRNGPPLDPWLPFPQRSCCFGFGERNSPIPVGALLKLWESGAPFRQVCPDCGGTSYMIGCGGLLTISSGIMICTGCDRRWSHRLRGGIATPYSMLKHSVLEGTEFAVSSCTFGGAISSGGEALRRELGVDLPLDESPRVGLSIRVKTDEEGGNEDDGR